MWFKKKSIRKQLKLIVGLTSMIFLMLCIFINMSIKELVYLNTDEHTKVTAIKLKDQIELTYDKMKTFSMSLREDEDIQKLMVSSMAEKTIYIQNVTEKLTQYKILEPTIEDISLVNDEVHYSTIYGYKKLDELRYKMQGSSFAWIGVYPHEFRDSKSKPDMFVYGGDIMYEGKNVGTLIISIKFDFLQVEGESQLSSYYMLANEKEAMVSLNSPQDVAEEVYTKWRENPEKNDMKEPPFYIHAYYFEAMDCYLISALDTRKVNIGLEQIGRLVWMCVILLLLFFGFFLTIINKGLVKPLDKFDKVIKNIRASGQRSLKGKLDLDGCSEIEAIGNEFSGMLVDIQKMNKKIFETATDLYEMEVQKKEAELAYLRGQINPHFLYNTLEVIRQMALVKEAPEIATMVVDMGKIFRYSTKGEPTVKLEEEISIIKSYIRIQQMRFHDKIQVYYFIPEEVLSVTVIKMLIQPAIENAIFHGLESINRQGSLFIGARIEGENLIITIKDDGIGIQQEKLQEIKKALKEEKTDTSKYVGVLNTNARIRLYYGPQYGLSIDSCKEDGTTVTITLKAE
ncbi:MAG: sensor histidine kinase [Suipraeoptans sp.]